MFKNRDSGPAYRTNFDDPMPPRRSLPTPSASSAAPTVETSPLPSSGLSAAPTVDMPTLFSDDITLKQRFEAFEEFYEGLDLDDDKMKQFRGHIEGILSALDLSPEKKRRRSVNVSSIEGSPTPASRLSVRSRPAHRLSLPSPLSGPHLSSADSSPTLSPNAAISPGFPINNKSTFRGKSATAPDLFRSMSTTSVNSVSSVKSSASVNSIKSTPSADSTTPGRRQASFRRPQAEVFSAVGLLAKNHPIPPPVSKLQRDDMEAIAKANGLLVNNKAFLQLIKLSEDVCRLSIIEHLNGRPAFRSYGELLPAVVSPRGCWIPGQRDIGSGYGEGRPSKPRDGDARAAYGESTSSKKDKMQKLHRFSVFGWHPWNEILKLVRPSDEREGAWECSHLCHCPPCVNPDHIVIETHAANERRKNCLGAPACVHRPQCIPK